jgi:hypothetical protein
MMPEAPFVPLDEMLGCAPGKPKFIAVLLAGTGLMTPLVIRKACPGALDPQ